MPDQETIRVLIIDDISETRENIQRLLQFEKTIEVVGAARNGKEGIELSTQLNPDVVIMDINMPDMDGIKATEEIRRKLPTTQVVILSVQTDSNYMREAMVAGARNFLPKPPSIEELIAAVKKAGAVAVEEREKLNNVIKKTGALGPISLTGSLQYKQLGKVIVIYSPKGGTGCTTLATNLAITLQNEGSTCLVDGNLQNGDVAIFMSSQVRNTILDLAQRIDEIDDEVVEEVAIKHPATGVSIFAAPATLDITSQVSGDQFSRLLQFLRRIYSFIVVDTTPYLTEAVAATLDIADLIVLITTQDIPSIKNSQSFLQFADTIGIKRERILFIMNQYDRRISISPDRVSNSLKQTILATIPYDDISVASSINHGIPIIVNNKVHPFSKAVISLGEQIRNQLSVMETEGNPA